VTVTLPTTVRQPFAKPGLELADWQTPLPHGWCFDCWRVCEVAHSADNPQPADPAELIAAAARNVLLHEVLDDVAEAELSPVMAARITARLDRLITTFTARPVVSR